MKEASIKHLEEFRLAFKYVNSKPICLPHKARMAREWLLMKGTHLLFYLQNKHRKELTKSRLVVHEST